MDKNWEKIARDLEREVKRAVKYVDTQVVPAARKEAHLALANLSRELAKLSDKLKD